MTAKWEDVSKPAKGWDTVAKPLNPPPPSPVDIAAEEEAKRAEAKRLVDIKEQEHREKVEREEARRSKERKIQQRKEFEKRLDKRNRVRQKTLHRGFLIDQFTETATRIRKATKPVVLTTLILGFGAMALTLMFKVATGDYGNCFGFGGQGGTPVAGDGGGTPPPPQPPSPPPPPGPKPDPHGYDIPDDPNGVWGWDKHCDANQKDKCTPPGYKEPGVTAAPVVGGAPKP